MTYCLLRAPLGALYTMDAKFLDSQLATGATLVSHHTTLTEAGGASIRLQLDESRRVREDAAALGGKLLLATVIGVSVTRDDASRRCYLHLTTPSGGTLVQVAALNQIRELDRILRRTLRLDQPGAHVLAAPIPITLRLVDDPVRRDAQVARWNVIGVRAALQQHADELRALDVLVLDGAHWLVRDFTPNGILATRFTGTYGRPRADEPLREFTLNPVSLYQVERRLDFIPSVGQQMPASLSATL